MNNRSNASGEWEDFFNFVPNKKDSVAVVKAGETAIIDDFPLDTIEYVEPWYESFFLKINDYFYLGPPKTDSYSESLGIEKSKIKTDNLHRVKITDSAETPSMHGSLVAKKTNGLEEGKIYRNFSEIISVTINADSVQFSLDAVEF
ncbi:hypothetical protein [Treponema zioleckii]|uniref:hypothetical protein n=1 Tax=Treponema zioleckii TaxID=331680 RepID=UPI00168B714A|nr:hypothetical protein [Treponema zioleckii]